MMTVNTTTARVTWALFGAAAFVGVATAIGCGKASLPEGDPHTGAEPAAAADPSDMPAQDGAPADAAPGSSAEPAGSAAPAAGPAKSPPGEEAPKPSAMDLGGKLSPDQISKFVEEHQSYFDPCIAIAEKGGPTYKVSITTKAYVGPLGRVNTTEVLKSTAKDKAFDTCVTDAFKKIHFGKPKEGATATLTFPMTFSGAVQ
jgi:hypothetical protein